jgi:hypothetical protein
MSVIPRELNYGELPPVLDASIRSTTINITPSNNKSSYGLGEYMDFDFPKQGFIDPKSIYLSYVSNVDMAASTVTTYMFGTPFATPLARVEESCKSGTLQLNTITQYNQFYNDVTQLKMSSADKYGVAPALGWYNEDTGLMENLDGRKLVGAASAQTNLFAVSGPLYGLVLSNASRFPCMQHLGGYRIRVYIENSLSKMFEDSAKATGFKITNPIITCDIVDTSPELLNALSSQPYVIKSNTYANASQPVPASSAGTLQLSYANAFSSLKHVIIHPNTTKSTQVNGQFDAVDITTTSDTGANATSLTGGYYQLSIGNVSFPQQPLNTGLNKGQVFMEMKKAVGLLYGNNNLSINRIEFNYGSGATTTNTIPGKFLPVVDCTRISALSENLLNGISTKNTPINLILNMASSNASAGSVNLIMNYDVLINVDPINNQVSLSV